MISEMLLQCHIDCAKTYQILSPVLFSAIPLVPPFLTPWEPSAVT